MPDIRQDPLTGHRVLISEARANRPQATSTESADTSDAVCPFCEGNEAETPGEVAAIRPTDSAADGPGWSVRVVPNKYPALATVAEAYDFDPTALSVLAVGAHEVIIESPRHVASWTELSPIEIDDVLAIYQQRLLYWREHSNLQYAILFKNLGHAAGASQYHAHSQLLALPLVPEQVGREHAAALREFERRQKCAYCESIEHEIESTERIVAESDGFIAFCPLASRLPCQVRVLPRRHASRFCRLSPADRLELAELLKGLFIRLEMVLPIPAYNFWLQTLPLSSLDAKHFHWHIEILPRQSNIAGFEWGTGYTINSIPPEQAAALLRNVAG